MRSWEQGFFLWNRLYMDTEVVVVCVCVWGGGGLYALLLPPSTNSYSWDYVIVWSWCWQSVTTGKQFMSYNQFHKGKHSLVACQQIVRHFVSEQTHFLLSVLSAADNLEKNPVVNPSGKNLWSLLDTKSHIWFYQIYTYMYLYATMFVIQCLVKATKFYFPSTFLAKVTPLLHAIYSEIKSHKSAEE